MPSMTKITKFIHHRIVVSALFALSISCLAVLLPGCSDSVDKVITKGEIFYRINELKCVKCALCYFACPSGAISQKNVGNDVIYIIDPDLCIRCGACMICPSVAIDRIDSGKEKQ